MGTATLVMTSTQFEKSHLAQAVVAFIDNDTWLIRGKTWRESGLSGFRLMPHVDCPVIDLSLVSDEKALQQVMAEHVSGNDVSGMIAALVALGAVVVSPVAS